LEPEIKEEKIQKENNNIEEINQITSYTNK
jgi:hypothetical protein